MVNLNLLGARMDFDIRLLEDETEYMLSVTSRIQMQTYMRNVLDEVNEVDVCEVIANIKECLPFEVNDITLFNTHNGPLIKVVSQIPLKDFNTYFREDIYEYLSCKHFSSSGYELLLSSNLRPTLRERGYFENHPRRLRRRVDEKYKIDDDSEVFEEV